jgi:hypothetical protein
MAIARTSQRWPLLIVAVLTGVVATGCKQDTPTPAAGGSTQTSSTQTSSTQTSSAPPPTAATGKSTDYCTLAEKIATESGVMINKHFIPLQNETLDMFKAVVNLTLAAKDQLPSTLPANIKAAFQVELQYFQALKDSNFDSTAAPPAGFVAANKTINDYGVSACGFVFDQ